MTSRFIVMALISFSAYAQSGAVRVEPRKDELPRHAASLDIVPMTFQDQTSYYFRHSFDVGSLLTPVIPAAIFMASPPRRYPRQWRNGGAAFGRNFGDALASETAANTGKYFAAAVLHEDPRYYQDNSRSPLHRVFYALAFTLVDRSTAGAPRLAISNFAGSLSGGFVGRAYLPTGYGDTTHALQRAGGILGGYAGTQLVGFATGNLVAEFKPELISLGKKLHLPFVQ